MTWRGAVRIAAAIALAALGGPGSPAPRARGAPAAPELEKVTPAWTVPGGWELLGSAGDAEARNVALLRGSEAVTVPVEGWRARDLFRRGPDGDVELLYGPETGQTVDPISRLPVDMSDDGRHVLFGTWRQQYPQGHDLRVWSEGIGERVAFASGKNFDLNLAALSADGRAAAVVEIRPLTLENRVYAERLYRWREGQGVELLAEHLEYRRIRGIAIDADGGRVAYALEIPSLEGTGQYSVRLVESPGDEIVVMRGLSQDAWGTVALSPDGRALAAHLPGAPIEAGGPLGAPEGHYLWREGEAVHRLEGPLPAYRLGTPQLGWPGELLVAWMRQDGPTLPETMLGWTSARGARPVPGPGGAPLSGGALMAGGRHWLVGLDDGPEGPGLYRYGPVPLEPGPAPAADDPSRSSPAPARWGGSGADEALAVAWDGVGGSVVVGRTHSDDLPGAASGAQPARGGGYDAFVLRRDADGRTVFATYLGGAGYDEARAVAVAPDGDLVVAGHTASPAFPATEGALQRERRGATDAFVARYAPDGTRRWATLLGDGAPLRGTDDDAAAGYELGRGVGVAPDGVVVVAGTLLRSALATTPGAAVPAPLPGAHDRDGFVVRLSAAGDRIEQATYLALVDRFGTRPGQVNGLALGADGAAFLAADADERDAFVVKLSPDLGRIAYSTHIGCCVESDPGIFGDPGIDHAAAVAVDAAGRVHATGLARGSAFPAITPGAFQPALGGLLDGYVARLAPDGALESLSYLGGAGDDVGLAIAADADGRSLVAGATGSAGFPAADAEPPPVEGCALCTDGFLAVVEADGRSIAWSGRAGGRLEDALAAAAAAPASGGIRVALGGGTRSPDVGPAGGPERLDVDALLLDGLLPLVAPPSGPIFAPVAFAR